MTNERHNFPTSWPGLSRPSTSCLLLRPEDVDARHIGVHRTPSVRTAMPGHDDAFPMTPPSRSRVTLCEANRRFRSYMKANHRRGTHTMKHRSAVLVAAALAFSPLAAIAEPAVTIPPPAAETSAQGTGLETAVL